MTRSPYVVGSHVTGPLLWPPRRRPVRPLALAVAALVALAATVGVARAEDTDGPRAEPTSRGERAAVQALAEAHFPPELVGWAVRTAGCETGYKWNLDAHSAGFDRRLGVWFDFYGPWQVDAITWAAKAWDLFGAPLSDPDTSAAMAAWIATTYGTGNWPVCGTGG